MRKQARSLVLDIICIIESFVSNFLPLSCFLGEQGGGKVVGRWWEGGGKVVGRWWECGGKVVGRW